ncbi:MAG: HAMP domain-containing histidine kinase [Gammaproteobacteria bacterium]|nr:HAMP domain-containing histidine kinase [Gammaproteobacteria bacterium]MBL6999751.1 HAMP domain-containing histidine kinase [Gammaproteobacteria bacterium]
MLNFNNRFRLHRRIANLLIIIAIIGSLAFGLFIWLVINKFEHAMFSTLSGHEIDEILIAFDTEDEIKMPNTAAMKGFLLSQQQKIPIPDFLKRLEPGVYNDIRDGDRIHHVTVMEIQSDRLYLYFDVTHISSYSTILLMLLIGGGVLSSAVLVFSGLWFSRKFLQPVSSLAEQMANINPTDRNVRFEQQYGDYEVGLIARAMDQFMDRMDDFVEREQSFTSAVSHELRTPVTVLATATELLEMDEQLSERQHATLKRMKKTTRQMSETIESLLFFARHERDTFDNTIPPISVNALFNELIEEYQRRAQDKKLTVELRPHAELLVKIPESHLTIMVGNLVQNAINHVQQGCIYINILPNGFSVEDSGEGIPGEEIEHIIKRGYHSPDSPGCGLGLYLVTSLCRHYELKFEIFSTPGTGSIFSIHFPADTAA